MSQHPPGDRHTHRVFCETEGWEVRTSARGRRGQDHVTFELSLPDGRVLLTRVSHPVDRTTYGRSISSHILRDQLDVTEDEFWACVQDGTLPARSREETPDRSLPAWLVQHLLDAGITAEAISAMDEHDAKATLGRIWSGGAPDP
ncbi:hypothetical protein [Cellulomonas bogoriensis]|uniref:Cytotoxic translational repressor of toxin-antitoxin stability system n=1 Tax=Cellulomonas bogoriensis 69B4 = DSM 16987 TaxID=1386082 RepID=A0A0A0C0E3_9CELL|nr:hypothetical protein [Cellulomonas bogoriensis]KGM13646.1 cytotoxic translational repressor of toxin-antitoxin stability system [Cellulomonas bogoriensis 69B4 = DSM 16987]